MKPLLKSIIILLTSVLWCEWLYYHYVIRIRCSGWPDGDHRMTNMLVISDTHIMGRHKSFWVDKWRREWEMRQSYAISTKYLKPDVIINLGDLLDEGAIYDVENFQSSAQDYKRILKSSCDNSTEINVPGNHDMGNHDRITAYPFLIDRFSNEFNTTPFMEFVETNDGIVFVVMNSMLFHDSCTFCRHSNDILTQIGKQLNHVRPILLTHIPLYRPDDSLCDKPLNKSQINGPWEGSEVIDRKGSDRLLRILRPRLILSGHSHKNCIINHQVEKSLGIMEFYKEITLTSYNHKYDENPKFLLMSVNSTHVLTNHCNLISEYHIISVYLASLIVIFVMVKRSINSNNNNDNLRGAERLQIQ